MKKLIITFVRQYRKSPTEKQRLAGNSGSIVFVYKVKGPEAEINNYLETKKEFINSIKQADGQINFFAQRFVGQTGELMLTAKNQWVVDTTEADQLASLTAQYGYEQAKDMMKKTVAE